ncbi:hypothetical protein OG698_22100 [Streptomyces sp. NBC_01003]|nr:hypothetical protein OG698_22100 [Streptomyces sp. NBC_01003]
MPGGDVHCRRDQLQGLTPSDIADLAALLENPFEVVRDAFFSLMDRSAV